MFQQVTIVRPGTLVFYEAPHRILRCLKDLREVLGDRQAVLAWEMTKVHDEFLRGPISHLEQELRSRRVLSEIKLLVCGSHQAEAVVPHVPGSPQGI